MVDVTYQMVLSTLQTVGLLVGIFYYVLTLRNQQKNQEISQRNQKAAHETRQLQYLLEFNKELVETTHKNLQQYWDAMTAEWTDFDDYLEKHGPYTEHFNYRMTVWNRNHITGLMIRDGLIDVKTYVEYVGQGPVLMWNKYKDIIYEYRKRFQNPIMHQGWEILASEIEKYRIEQGWGPTRNVVTMEDLFKLKPES